MISIIVIIVIIYFRHIIVLLKLHHWRFSINSAKCRRYMIAYNTYNGDGDALTYKAIEHFVKIAKCHRNIAHQDKAFVEKAWKEAILNLDEN